MRQVLSLIAMLCILASCTNDEKQSAPPFKGMDDYGADYSLSCEKELKQCDSLNGIRLLFLERFDNPTSQVVPVNPPDTGFICCKDIRAFLDSVKLLQRLFIDFTGQHTVQFDHIGLDLGLMRPDSVKVVQVFPLPNGKGSLLFKDTASLGRFARVVDSLAGECCEIEQ